MSIILVVIIAISLSMDAFSLSLAYGTLNLEKKYRVFLSVVVGIYHFLMPLIGMLVGNNILKKIPIDPDMIVCLVLIVIGIEMLLESFKNDRNIHYMKIGELLLFGLAVSLDSFSVGLGLNTIYKYPIVSAFLFSISSSFFTCLGLSLGSKINEKIGKVSTLIGGICLIVIGIFYSL